MTLGSFNHTCLATPVNPISKYPLAAYERPVPLRPAKAVVPGERLTLNDKEKGRLKIYGNSLARDKDDNSSIYHLDTLYYDNDADSFLPTENSFPGMILSQREEDALLQERSRLISFKDNEYDLRNKSTSSARAETMIEFQVENSCNSCQIDDHNNEKVSFYEKLQRLKLENRKLLGTLSTYYTQLNESNAIDDKNMTQEGESNIEQFEQKEPVADSDGGNISDPTFVLEMHNESCDNKFSSQMSSHITSQEKSRLNVSSQNNDKQYISDSSENYDDDDLSNEIIWKRKMSKIFDGIESDSETEISPKLEERKRTRVKSAPLKRQKKEFVPTVPEPFGMTLRDEQKRKEKKLLEEVSNIGVDDDSNKKEEEDSRLFKAKGVPNHVNQPIFQNMVIEQPKRYAVGPMSRIKRVKSEDSINNNFKAKPFPSEIFTSFAYEKMKEDIAYRNIRKEIRQKELLAASLLPPRMKSALEKQTTENKKETKKSHKNKPNTTIKGKPVPDFERLYQEFYNNMENNKSSRITTVPEPFTFDDEVKQWQERRKNIGNRPQSANVAMEGGNANFEANNKSAFSNIKAKVNSRPYVSNPNLSASVTANVLNSTCNTTSYLRAQKNKERLEKETRELKKEEKKRVNMAVKQRELRIMNPAWAEMGAKKEVVLDERRQERLKQERETQREYQMKLDRMYLKVLKQPTLFQRQSRMSAKQNAEKKYNEVLKKEGLTEDDVTRSYEVKKERRSSKSSMSDLTWVSKPCPISSIKSAVKANVGSNTISQIDDVDESCHSIVSEKEFYD